MKALKAFVKPFEAPQRRMKIKILVNSPLCPGEGRKVLNMRNARDFRIVKTLIWQVMVSSVCFESFHQILLFNFFINTIAKSDAVKLNISY